MADLTVYITEKITLDSNTRNILTTQTISNIANVDNRVLSIPTGSLIKLFYFSSSMVDAATFTTSSFKYGRITNKSSNPIKLDVTYNNSPSNAVFEITAGSSFMLSSTKFSGSYMAPNNFTYNDYITSITVESSGSSSTVEYFIATT